MKYRRMKQIFNCLRNSLNYKKSHVTSPLMGLLGGMFRRGPRGGQPHEYDDVDREDGGLSYRPLESGTYMYI